MKTPVLSAGVNWELAPLQHGGGDEPEEDPVYDNLVAAAKAVHAALVKRGESSVGRCKPTSLKATGFKLCLWKG